jgi:hypothetical protein
MATGHRVMSIRGPKGARLALPKDTRQGATLRTADGRELETVWNGYGPIPGCNGWPQGMGNRTHELRAKLSTTRAGNGHQ